MNNKKKLLIVNGAQFGHSSGHYFYCKYLSEDFIISYICYDRELNRITLEGVDIHYVSFNGSKSARIFRFLKECIKLSSRIKPNLLLVTYFNLCFILALFCKSRKKILDIRTGSLNENNILRRIGNIFVFIQSLCFNRIIILSDSLRKKLFISSKKSNIVPLGSEIMFAGNHNFNSVNLLYLGALDDRKISETLKGLQLFLQKNERNSVGLSYCIVGFGSESETLKIENCISDYNLSDYVKFEGRKTPEELVTFFELSNIGVAYITQNAGYDCQPATKLFEYMLSGMPVIATNTYENRQIVHEKNGVLINDSSEDFCNGLMQIYNQRNLFNSSEVRKSVKDHTWENIVNNNLKPFLLGLIE
jgi:glycosyltransferase involved in cell wall biosynthesis